ncbi:DUF2897 family protein [Glaciecola petra]|uniref:DUF2897 family protein n=1 Tax=Glaciecola petra TaxID=3075602 RepID=A0ABU2ZNF6_9ALTE|nr:DUF2897 family protein [Aestuariibacter sp. P117]MDT0594145.1 DUF2897 family protein [Aestuariibacter sp. P117]
MQLSLTWVIVIIVVVFAVIISNITLLKKSNKPFEFSDAYEKQKEAEKNKKPEDDQDKPSGLI